MVFMSTKCCFTTRSQQNYQADHHETWCQRKTYWILEQIKNDSVDTKHCQIGNLAELLLYILRSRSLWSSTSNCSNFMRKAEHALEQCFHGQLLLQRQQGFTVKLRSGHGNIVGTQACTSGCHLFWYNWNSFVKIQEHSDLNCRFKWLRREVHYPWGGLWSQTSLFWFLLWSTSFIAGM